MVLGKYLLSKDHWQPLRQSSVPLRALARAATSTLRANHHHPPPSAFHGTLWHGVARDVGVSVGGIGLWRYS